MTLVQDPGRAAKPVLMSRFIRSGVRGRARSLALQFGLKKLNDAVPDDWKVPDSDIAVRAIAAADAVCPDFIIRHSYRTYCFGALLAARDGLKLDREIFFLAAILHDLGLSEKHADDAGSFEWVGAGLAHDFCLQNGQAEERAALVHDAIALHTSAGIANKCQPEIAMVHFGAGLDLFGMRLEEIPADVLAAILEKHSRDDFKACFGPCLQHQADTKPKSSIAGPMALGLSDMIQETLGNA